MNERPEWRTVAARKEGEGGGRAARENKYVKERNRRDSEADCQVRRARKRVARPGACASRFGSRAL